MKIQIAVDVKSKRIISLKGTNDEHVNDGKVLPRLIEDITKSKHVIAEKVFADGGAYYDSNAAAVFRDLLDSGIMPCIKVRRNARVKKTNNIFRNLLVISQKHDLQRWKDSIVRYGQR